MFEDIILKLLNREIDEEFNYLVNENQLSDRDYLDELIHAKWKYIKKNSKNTLMDNLVLKEIIDDDKKKYLMGD